MELFSKATLYSYWTCFIFSLVVVGQGDVLAICNPSKERDAWNDKFEVARHERSRLQKKLLAL